jgi:hypothetical protein
LSKIEPLKQIQFAKLIAPEIFENKTPQFHIKLLEFLNSEAQKKAVAVFRGGGKSTILNKINIFNRIFFKNEPYILIISESERKAKSFLRDIKRLVIRATQKSIDIRQGDTWSETSAEIISSGKMTRIDVFGAGQDPRGYVSDNKRPTLIILDDIENKEKMRSREQREKLRDWLYADLFPSLHPDGEILFVGTIMHEESELNLAIRSEEWKSVIFPILVDGNSAWGSRFPLEKIERIKKELFAMGMHDVFYQEYLCVAQSKEKQLFKKEFYSYFNGLEFDTEFEKFSFKNAVDISDITIRKPINIIKADGSKLSLSNCYIYSTMDLASTGKDKSAIVTIAADSEQNIYIIDISAGHWTPFEKSLNALKVQKEFNPIRFGIERAGSQNDFFYTIDVAQKESGVYIPVEELRHGGINKNIRIANLHPYFVTKKIHFNSSDMNTSILEAQLGAFNIDIESISDDIMDALAYHLQFIKNRTFEIFEDNVEDGGAWS